MAYTGVSIVDYLKSVGQDSSYASRKAMAASLGIKNYSGTTAQNTQMLNTLRNQAPQSQSTQSTQATQATNADTVNATVNAVLNNPRQSLDSIIQQIQSATGTTKDTYVKPELLDTIDPRMLGIKEFTDLLGIDYTYDRASIEKILQDAVSAEYDLRGTEQSNTERKFNKNMAVAQETALDTIRQQMGAAVAQGATKGMSAANQLSAVLGVTQQASDEATQLALDRQLMAKEQGVARSQATANALSQSNEAFLNYGGLARQYYNDQIQQLAAELSYNQGINTDYAGYQANKYSADQSLLASMQASGSNIYNNNNSSIAAIQQAIENATAQRYAADQQLAAQRVAANANLEAARIAASAAKANIGNYGGGGGGGGGAADDGLDEVTNLIGPVKGSGLSDAAIKALNSRPVNNKPASTSYLDNVKTSLTKAQLDARWRGKQ